MKKLTTIMALALVCVLTVVCLCACSVNQASADKINQAVKDGNPFTIDDLKKSFGNPTIDGTGELLGKVGGTMIWVNGCKDSDAVQAKLDKGQKLEALTVIIADGKAVSAKFGEYKK